MQSSNPKRPLRVIVCLGIFLSMLAGVAAAETLRILEWGGVEYEQFQPDFLKLVKEKYGVELNLAFTTDYGDDKGFSALRDDKVDIILINHNVPRDKRFPMIDVKLVLPLNLENIPNYKHLQPALQKSAAYWTENDKVYGIPLLNGLYGLAYNTALVKEAPPSWQIFWDPAFENRYALEDNYEYAVYLAALAMGVARADLSDYKKLNTPEFQKKLGQLAMNAKVLSVEPQDVKGLALAATWGNRLNALSKIENTWKFAEPQEGSISVVLILMIGKALKDKPVLKQIAEEWFNYLLKDEVQLFNLLERASEPVTTTVKDKLTPEEVRRFHLDDPTFFDRYRIFCSVLEKLDRKGFARLWEKALGERK